MIWKDTDAVYVGIYIYIYASQLDILSHEQDHIIKPK